MKTVSMRNDFWARTRGEITLAEYQLSIFTFNGSVAHFCEVWPKYKHWLWALFFRTSIKLPLCHVILHISKTCFSRSLPVPRFHYPSLSPNLPSSIFLEFKLLLWKIIWLIHNSLNFHLLSIVSRSSSYGS